ncbi:heterokaryon incompatibility protein-domain-containing protein [Stachybotrys elegans]|uniref:Heterokaryon incompatibility protein-domain-containing protein n=1 Tax=Stachybotrys elegans TaxID=80388 RepID=A0A8K0SHD0_9HYPO|nr:heterokaryon incompatibility protein-domain-containing protein [Stachybotrys elegans]
MRLINVHSLDLEEFSGSNIPAYAILSHTWDKNEATFREWTGRRARMFRWRRPAILKVWQACKQARRDGFPYLWVDTVCIDKSSSSELSEAINSMFAWYQHSKVCYAYLCDVCPSDMAIREGFKPFEQSKWFTRGWTLQELIAPQNFIFYSGGWKVLGNKRAMATQLSQITNIDALLLLGERRLDQFSIAQRMAWAARRSTTRKEDMAYCLLGVFNIAMPLLYGEGGDRAFRRLQEEVIRASDDHSILAFDTNLSSETLFSHHPITFAGSNKIQKNMDRKITAPFSMSNAGLTITTPLIQTLSPFWVLAVLNCVEVDVANNSRLSQVCLPLFGKDNKYMRARSPVTLICRLLHEGIVGLRDEIVDLGPRVESTYLISNFAKIYSAYGTEMDAALKGFQIEPVPAAGFMITFPQGMGGYELYESQPAGALHSDISFFAPYSLNDSLFAGGLLVFKRSGPGVPRYIAVYMGLELDTTNRLLHDWICRVVNMDYRDPSRSFKEIAEDMQRKHHHGLLGTSQKHYHHQGDFIVAARTRFHTLQGEPSGEMIMAELVFNAEPLVTEWDNLVLEEKLVAERDNSCSGA